MVGDRRREFARTVKDAAEKAGTLVTAALVIAGAALLLALVSLALTFRPARVRAA